MTFTSSPWCYTIGICSLVLEQLAPWCPGLGSGLLHTVLDLREKCWLWAAVPSISGHQGILENVHCAQRVMLRWWWVTCASTCRTFSTRLFQICQYQQVDIWGERRLFFLFPKPSSGSSKPGKWIPVVQSMTELRESRSKLHPFCLLSVPRGCSSMQRVFLAQNCCVAAPVTSCPCVLLPTPAWGAPTSLQSHPLCVAVVAQGKEEEPKHGWWGPGSALHCCRCGRGWPGGRRCRQPGGACSPPPDLSLQAEWSQLLPGRSEYLD